MKSVNLRKIMTKLMAATMSFVMLAVLLFVSAVEVKAYNQDTSSGVVAIVCINKSTGVVGRGTGFFVGKEGENPQYIVTNLHVVDDWVKNSSKSNSPWEIRVMYDEKDYDVAYVVDSGTLNVNDVAILDLKKTTDKRHALKLLEPTESMVGEDVYAVGFPASADNEFTASSKFGLKDVNVQKGSVNRLASQKNGIDTIETDAKITGGNSGGPLVTEEGYVIGINTYSTYRINPGDIRNYAIHINNAIRMLNNNNIKFEMADSSSSSSGESVSTTPEGDSSTEITAPEPDSKGGLGFLAVIFVIAIVVVVAVVVIIIVASKKTKSGRANTANRVAPVAPQPVAVPAPQVAQRTPMVRSMAAQHNGASFAIRDVLTVGRDASCCDIVYQQGTPGVSGKHCTIEYRPQTNVFIVTDLNSSYGTFLMNGVKMEPNRHYSFNPGDTFFVGDKANVIRVEVN